MGPFTWEQFLEMPLFRAYDLEHAALIAAGHPVQWPEESAAREQRAADLAGKIADFFTPAPGGRK